MSLYRLDFYTGESDILAENVTVKKLRTNQNKALTELVISGNVTKAASKAGVQRQTVYRWLQEPEFAAVLREAEDAALRDLSRQLVGLGQMALDTLHDAMADDRATWGVRIRAALGVLQHRVSFHELVSLTDRIAALEEKIL